MRSRGACLVLALVVAVPAALPRTAWGRAPGDDNDLGADDDGKAPAKPADKPKDAAGFGTYTPPVQTIGTHAYTLAECLALTDRNFPNLWAARARLAASHAQLDEAKWTPWSQWNLESRLLVLGALGGTPVYTAQGQASRNLTYLQNAEPWFTADLNGVIPLYTFGKISAIQRAGEAQIRLNEWDLEKARQAARMDVRRAFFGAMAARDGRYIVNDAIAKLEGGIKNLEGKLARNEGGVEEVDKIRLQVILEETRARAGEADRGERFAMAALRFYTGVQTAFDIPDEPLKRPDVVIAPLVRYLSAARIFRPEVNMARAGIAARQAQVEYARAQYFPDIGLGVGASYSIAPAATPQYGNVWANDPFNHFYAGAALGLRWGLDLLPKSARASQAESQLEEARALERLALGGIAVEVENAYGVMVEAKRREEAWDRDEHLTKQWIASTQDAIELGTKDDRAILEPLRYFLNARISHITALMDLNVALSDLGRVSGWDAAAPK